MGLIQLGKDALNSAGQAVEKGLGGIFGAAGTAIGGVFADQWREYFYCDSMDENTLVTKAQKRTSSKSANKKGSDNIISNGSIIAVNEGQCAIIVDQGKVVELCAVPGEFQWDASTEPSLFAGKLGTSIVESFKTMGKRFTFGGDTAKDQRVYFFNLKEIPDNRFGTPQPVPFRIVVSEELGFKITVDVRMNGTYSYHIVDPIKFYTVVSGNVTEDYTRDRIDATLKAELITALQPAMAEVSAKRISYDQLPAYADDFAAILNEQMKDQWGKRGIAVFSMNISTPSIPPEQRAKLQELEDNVILMNPNMGAARLIGAQGTFMQNQGEAMKIAADNDKGAVTGFMGMGMVGGMPGMGGMGGMGSQVGAQAASLYQMGQAPQYQAPAPAAPAAPAAAPAGGWTCQCGNVCQDMFCSKCGSKKPEQAAGGFCTKCGNKYDAGAMFCSKCGNKLQ
jgi:membrane protease subunit (stomatin/prohibitin family)